MSLSRLKKWIYGSASVGLVIGVTVFAAILYASDQQKLSDIAPSVGQVRDDSSSVAMPTPDSSRSQSSAVAVWLFGSPEPVVNTP